MAEFSKDVLFERAQNEYDASYIQTSMTNLDTYISMIQGPEDLMNLQTSWKRGKNRITDEDGDGVEDNVDKTSAELDKFIDPYVFMSADDINNTRHGNLPGHTQWEFSAMEVEPDSMELVKNEWTRL